MHISLKGTPLYIALLVASSTIFGCQSPFDQVYCSASGYLTDSCLSGQASAPPGPQSTTPSAQSASTAPQTPAAPKASNAIASTPPQKPAICPDKPGTRLYVSGGGGGGSSGWNPTPCETVIVGGAINHCLQVTERTAIWDNLATLGQQSVGVGSAIAGAASTIAGAVTSTPPAYLAGAALLGANLVTNVKSLFSATPSTPTPSNMVNGAQNYASLYANLTAPSDRPDIFYAGLWNATGSACPPNLVFGNFQRKQIDLAEAGNPEYFPVSVLSSSYSVSFSPGSDALDMSDKSNWHAIEDTYTAYHDHANDPKFAIRVSGQQKQS